MTGPLVAKQGVLAVRGEDDSGIEGLVSEVALYDRASTPTRSPRTSRRRGGDGPAYFNARARNALIGPSSNLAAIGIVPRA